MIGHYMRIMFFLGSVINFFLCPILCIFIKFGRPNMPPDKAKKNSARRRFSEILTLRAKERTLQGGQGRNFFDCGAL
jgi:hypothetical protein